MQLKWIYGGGQQGGSDYIKMNFGSQETETPTRPVENIVLTTKGLQERNTQLLDGMTVEKQVK